MSRYGTLDDFGNRIRNEGEIAVIKKDLDQYLRTENDDFILRYLSYYGSLRETFKTEKILYKIICSYTLGYYASIKR